MSSQWQVKPKHIDKLRTEAVSEACLKSIVFGLKKALWEESNMIN